MTQYNTNMKQSSYYAYCNAWAACFGEDTQAVISRDGILIVFSVNALLANEAVRAGVVFG